MIDAMTAALRTALDGGDTNLELQMRLLAGTAGEYGQAMLIAAADRVLRSHLWPALTPRTSHVNVRRERIGVADANDLTIHTASVHFRNIQKDAGRSSNSRNPHWVVLIPLGKIP